VRGVGEQRPQADHGAGVELLAQLDELLAEAAPAHVGLDAADQHDVAPESGGRATEMRVVGHSIRRLTRR
jgi:hypothetical protein